MNDEAVSPIQEILDGGEDTQVSEPALKRKKSTKVSVTLINSRVFERDGVKHYLAVTNEGELKGYLVPADAVKYDTTNPQDLKDPEQYIQVYDWENEIAEMLPDMETIRRNILISFWKAGAIEGLDVPNETKRRMLNSAFPYPIPFKEND